MENETTPSVLPPARHYSVTTIVGLVLVVIIIILAGIGWYVGSNNNGKPGLTSAEREKMLASLGTTTPLSTKEREKMANNLGTTTPLTDIEQVKMLKALTN